MQPKTLPPGLRKKIKNVFDDVVTIRTYKYEYYIQNRCYKLRNLETWKVIVMKKPSKPWKLGSVFQVLSNDLIYLLT